MELNLNRSLLEKDAAASELVNTLEDAAEQLNLEEEVLYHNFPFYLNEDGSHSKADILLASRLHGIFLFQCINQSERFVLKKEVEKAHAELEQNFSLLFSKFLKYRNLRNSPASIKIDIHPVIFITNYDDENNFGTQFDVFADSKSLLKFIDENIIETPIEDEVFDELIATIEGSRVLTKKPSRNIPDDDKTSKGRFLETVDTRIAKFDKEQKRAALHIIDEPQRIRGLAGSGKTVILTMKAALIHLQEPDAEILYTFWTKSLYDQIKGFITKFYRQFSDKDPDWDKINILHAWGGKTVAGVYYNICLHNNIQPVNLSEARKSSSKPFNFVCQQLVKHDLKKAFDYSLLDEAQDFPKYFYQLCRKVTKGNKIVWAYDECQNILDIEIQDTKETFGKDDAGEPLIDFSSLPTSSHQDMVLHKCYRNPRSILFTAFSLGLGIYNERIIQMLENNEHWEDMGFEVIEGNSKKGDTMVIKRPESNSPLMSDDDLKFDEAVNYSAFDSFSEELNFISQQIKNDIDQNLRPEDILVISLDERNARKYFDSITNRLFQVGINTFNTLEAPYNTKHFKLEGKITLTTVYRAKGNEAGSVYICGIDSIFGNKNSIAERNKLFTAISRAHAWVTLTGVGEYAEEFVTELEKVKEDYPYLKFEMPDRKEMRIFQRDLSKRHAKLNKISRQLELLQQEEGISMEEALAMIQEKNEEKK